MATKVNQQETLFRFISIRPPELAEVQYNPSFVTHPDATGVFYDAVVNRPQGVTKWKAMEEEGKTFTPDSIKDLTTRYNDQLQKATWLAKNSRTATTDAIKQAIEAETPLDSNDVIKLWDNLFYQVIEQKDFYVKEAVSELIVLNNAVDEIKRITDPDPDFIRHLANANLLLPTVMFVEDKAEDNGNPVDEDVEPVFSTRKLSKSLDNSFAKYAIDRNETAVTELKKLQNKYAEAYNEAFENENNRHEQYIKNAYNTATYTEKEGIECATKCTYTYKDYDNLSLPAYNFTPPKEIEPAKLKSDLSEESYYVVESLGLLDEKTYEAIINGVNKSTDNYNKMLFNSIPAQRVVAFGGMTFQDNSSEKNTNPFLKQSQLPYVASFKSTSKSPDKGKLFMSIDVGYRGAEIASANYSARIGSTDIEMKSLQSEVNDNMLNLTLFPNNNGVEIPDGTSEFDLQATVVLTNATKFELNEKVTIGSDFKGVGKVTEEFKRSTGSNIAFQLEEFGIRRLGIADYRKVVSEVCCYRESEVSHIENIMAREFRSKTTERERTEENTVTTENVYEKENFTDTSTTERLEMQTEVSKFLEQQKEIGAYATLRGTYTQAGSLVTFETGGNFASNTAKAESNIQAVIESKEITETASERITTRFREETIRKVTERFREENSRIFDNREGENNVSGVYRFINAIYKNQIYNYGKRLMYEFMVPDPSRVHRLGSEIQRNTPPINANEPITITAPIHPSAGGLMNATQVVDGNYREFAAINNASVDAPPEQNPTIGKAFQGKGANGSSSTEHNEIKVPDGYRVTYIKYSFTMMQSEKNLFAKVQIGKQIL